MQLQLGSYPNHIPLSSNQTPPTKNQNSKLKEKSQTRTQKDGQPIQAILRRRQLQDERERQERL
jgi:hypothetical protein